MSVLRRLKRYSAAFSREELEDLLNHGKQYISYQDGYSLAERTETILEMPEILSSLHQANVRGLDVTVNFGVEYAANADLFFEALNASRLSELRLSSVLGLRNKGARPVLDFEKLGLFIKYNKSVWRLELDFMESAENGPANLVGFAQGLASNTVLCYLELSIWIDHDGAHALSKALSLNKCLRTLILNKAQFAYNAARAIADSLTKNTTLRELRIISRGTIQGHTFSTLAGEGCLALLHAIGAGGNRSLLSLDIYSEALSLDVLLKLEEILLENPVVDEILLCPIPDFPDQETCEKFKKAQSELNKRRQNRANREASRLAAFEEAKTSGATTPWLRSKLMVVGSGEAGKTNTVRSLLGISFNPKWDSTIGIETTEVATASGRCWEKSKDKDFASSFVYQLAVGGIVNREQNGQTRNQSSVRKTKPAMTRPTQSLKEAKQLLQTSSNSSNRKENPETTRTTLKEAGAGSSVATKPIIEECNEFEEITFEYDEELLIQQEERNIRMSIWDYGGQRVFYTLHHLFLTRYGVYVVVFNMVKLLGKNVDETTEYILFWLNSIKLHAPNAPVLLVGTFLDMLNDPKDVNEVSLILKELTASFDQVRAFESRKYYPISNKDKSGVSELRDAVEREMKNADFVEIAVSLKWMRALDILNLASNQADEGWLSLNDLKLELSHIGLEQGEEIERMLCLFHELGVVLYFSSSVKLKEVVIGKPAWLLQKLSLVIRDKDVHDYDREKLAQSQLLPELEYFLQNGIASRDILEFFWDGSQVDYLLALMRDLLLLSEWNFSSEEKYVIPSMLGLTETLTDKLITIKGPQFYFEFEFLPHGIFERVCCMCVSLSGTEPGVTTPQLFRSICIVDLASKGLIQVEVRDKDKIVVTLSFVPAASANLNFFFSMMRRIQNEFMHGGLKWQLFVGQGDQFIKHEEARKGRLEPWFKTSQGETSGTVEVDSLLSL